MTAGPPCSATTGRSPGGTQVTQPVFSHWSHRPAQVGRLRRPMWPERLTVPAAGGLMDGWGGERPFTSIEVPCVSAPCSRLWSPVR